MSEENKKSIALTYQELMEMIGIVTDPITLKGIKFESIESIDRRLLLDEPNDPLASLNRNNVICKCNPTTWVKAQMDADILVDYYRSRGLDRYADIVEVLNDKKSGRYEIAQAIFFEKRERDKYEGRELTEEEQEELDKVLSIDNIVEQIRGIAEIVETPISPITYSKAMLNIKTERNLQMNIEYPSECPRQENCPYLKLHQEKMLGRPCPFIIKKFIQHATRYMQMLYYHEAYLTEEPEQFSPNDLSPAKKSTIGEIASFKTKMDYLLIDNSASPRLKSTEFGLEALVEKNVYSEEIKMLNTLIDSELKRLGINYSDVQKIFVKKKEQEVLGISTNKTKKLEGVNERKTPQDSFQDFLNDSDAAVAEELIVDKDGKVHIGFADPDL